MTTTIRKAPTSASTPHPLRLKVAAAKFEDDAPPQAIIDYYKGEMRAYGDVFSSAGAISTSEVVPARSSRVQERFYSRRDVQLVVGTEDHHRIVVVKPRGAGSEFFRRSIQARGEG